MAKTPDATRSGRRQRPRAATSRPVGQPDRRAGLERRHTPAGREPLDDPAPPLPSSLDLDQRPSAARSGRAELEERQRHHRGDQPGHDGRRRRRRLGGGLQRRRRSAGRRQPDAGSDGGRGGRARRSASNTRTAKSSPRRRRSRTRDRHRWELDPASSEDYPERTHGDGGKKRQGDRTNLRFCQRTSGGRSLATTFARWPGLARPPGRSTAPSCR